MLQGIRPAFKFNVLIVSIYLIKRGENMFKKIIASVLATLMLLIVLPTKVLAEEIESTQNSDLSEKLNGLDNNIIGTDTFKIDENMYEIIDYANYRVVRIYNLENNTQREIIYNKLDETLTIDKISQKIHIEQPSILESLTVSATASNIIRGPYRTYFDINIKDTASLIGTLLAVSNLTAAFLASKLSTKIVAEGISLFLTWTGMGEIIDRNIKKYKSFNGFFLFSQEIQPNGCTVRNINRTIYARLDYENAYRIYSWGDSGWFETCRPY